MMRFFITAFPLLKKAYTRSLHKTTEAYRQFCERNQFWLPDYSLYMALKKHFGDDEWLAWEEGCQIQKAWKPWRKYKTELKEEIDYWKFLPV